MIRCNNCMETFENEEELSLIVEQKERIDGEWHTTDRFIYEANMELPDTENVQYEIFKGCPFCLGDDYLMDVMSCENNEGL